MCYNTRARGCSSMAERQLPKLNTRVRFPSPAPASAQSPLNFVSGNSLRLLPKTALTTLRLLPNPKHSASDLFFLLRAKSAQLRFRQEPAAYAENCVRSLAPPLKLKVWGFAQRSLCSFAWWGWAQGRFAPLRGIIAYVMGEMFTKFRTLPARGSRRRRSRRWQS